MNKNIENPKKYEAPVIEVFEVEVEKGFQESAPPTPSEPTNAGSSDGPWPGGAWG
jgi:hypothetical protein